MTAAGSPASMAPVTTVRTESSILAGEREGAGQGGRQSGQTLVEFTMVIPIRGRAGDGPAGAGPGAQRHRWPSTAPPSMAPTWPPRLATRSAADCLILELIEADLGAPNTPGQASPRSSSSAPPSRATSRTPSRPGRGPVSTDCTLPDGDHRRGALHARSPTGYPETQRCTVLRGCPALTPAAFDGRQYRRHRPLHP